MKSLSILGSTGSIGRQALEIAKSQRYGITALACKDNIQLLKQQVNEFSPEFVSVYDKEKAEVLSEQIDIPVISGMDGLIKAASCGDIVINSLVGSIGIRPTMQTISQGKQIALANKESLVAAGDLIMRKAHEKNMPILPIDSEHSALFQCLCGEDKASVQSLTLTCSGGPFLRWTNEELSRVKKEDALNHPKWRMGSKISIDSATLMNKGLEVIEAHHLFAIPYEQIKVVIHPESIIHSLVEFADSSVKAQMSLPDMRIPIQYALTFPKRLRNGFARLRLSAIKNLSFEDPDDKRFPCLSYACDAGRIGGSMPCAMNAANEAAVRMFLEGRIRFLDIAGIIRSQMDTQMVIKRPDLEEILDIDKKVQAQATQAVIGSRQ